MPPPRGLRGAAETIADAARALRVAATTGSIHWYAEDWPLAELTAVSGRLADVIAPIRAAATQNPHLAEAVRAYAAAGFSVSEAARMLRPHPNSVAYRLSRWRCLTGHDPRTATGLVPTLLALALAVSANHGRNGSAGPRSGPPTSVNTHSAGARPSGIKAAKTLSPPRGSTTWRCTPPTRHMSGFIG